MRAALLAVVLASSAFAQEPQYSETIDVVRYLLNLRAVDSAGRAITDLSSEDFEVTIDDERAHVESATWIGRQDRAETLPGENASDGRLFVLLMQTDFGRDRERVLGQLAFNPLADQIIESLDPQDRVAVFSHDSHLKLRLDFTLDRAAARKAVRDSIRIERLPLPPPSDTGASLVPHLDNDVMRKTYEPGASLLVIARALRAIEGEKTIILAGWGLDTMHASRITYSRPWNEAIAMLQEDHVPVLAVGTGAAGTQAPGLAVTAAATGGFYTNSRDFPHQTVTRIQGVMAGAYELFLRMDKPLAPGSHAVDVRIAQRNAAVFAPKLVTVTRSRQIAAEIVEVPDSAFVALSREEAAADLHLRAFRALQNGEADTAESLLGAAIATGIALPEAWYERGMLAAARGDLTSAAADLREYLQRMPHGVHARDARELLRTWQP